MAAGAEVIGVDVEQIYADALAQPQGSQKNAFSVAFAAAFPSPELAVAVAGADRYIAPFSTDLTGSAAGVAPPPLDPPTTNLAAADLPDLGGMVIIRSRTFPD